jgi:hypothetical protein
MDRIADRRGVKRRARARHNSQRGFVTVQYLVATAFSLILFVLAANVLVDLYVRAAVRDALDEATRAAVPAATDERTCEQRATEILRTLARGPLGRGVSVDCRIVGGRVLADAHVDLPSFVPGVVPHWSFDLHAVALREAL